MIANELRAYQTQNLLDSNFVTASVTANALPKDPQYAVTNLILNLQSRSSGNNLYPLIADSGGVGVSKSASYRSCYKTTNNELSLLANKLKIDFDLGESLFQHCIVLIQDLYNGLAPHEHTNENEYF